MPTLVVEVELAVMMYSLLLSLYCHKKYLERFVGILFSEIVKKNLALRNFRKYVACFVLRLVTDEFRDFYFRECRLTRERRED